MIGYLVWGGMQLRTVGTWRGIAAVVGLVGTAAYRRSIQQTTLVRTGLWSITYQFACITVSFIALVLVCLGKYSHPSDDDGNDQDHGSILTTRTGLLWLMIAGICASRIGLYVFDISVTQLMQEFIPSGIRGVVGGTQQSLNAFFQFTKFGLGLVWPDPAHFYIVVAVGYSAVCVYYVL